MKRFREGIVTLIKNERTVGITEPLLRFVVAVLVLKILSSEMKGDSLEKTAKIKSFS